MGARRRTIVGGHFLTMDDLADTTLDQHTVDERLTVIEREINTAVADLARTIDENYVMFVPQAFAESEAALRKTQKLLSDATFKLGAIEGAVQDMSEAPAANEDESVTQKLGVVKELKGRLDSLVHIEKDMSALWRLEATKEPLKVAEQITKVWKLLDEIVQEDGAADIFADRIHPALCDELVSRQAELAQFLDQYFRQRLTFASYEHVDPNKWTLKLSKDAEPTWTECFTAMEVIGKLDPALKTFATTFCDRFCETVVSSAACANSFKHRQVNGTETFQITKPTKKDERPTPELVFSKLTDIINYLSDGVGNTKIGETLLITAIGDRLRDRLMDLIVRDCLTPAVPMEKNASFSDVLGEATRFHNVMIEIELFRNDCKLLKDFCENHNKIFLERRCLKIMGDARTLISKPYIEMVEVGSNEDDLEENYMEFMSTKDNLRRAGHAKHIKNSDADQYLPKMYKFQKCKISSSVFKLVNHIYETLVAAGEAFNPEVPDGGMQSATIFETARNIVTMFVKIAPIHHKTAISTVPQIAAVFYNNCYYICHRLMTAGFDAELLMTKNQGKIPRSRLNFVEFFGPLRKLAAGVLEQHLANCRRQISTILSDGDMFVGLREEARHKKTAKTLLSVKMQLEQIATVWREVLTDSVYADSMGNIISHVLVTLASIVVSKEDITSHDAELTATLLQQFLTDMESLMKIQGYTLIHRVCEKSYYKMKEIIFCVNGSIQSISDRWCEGKGPLAQWVSADHVRRLIRALFQNTDRRAAVLSLIH